MSAHNGPESNWSTPVDPEIAGAQALSASGYQPVQVGASSHNTESWYSPPPVVPPAGNKRPLWIALAFLALVLAVGGGVLVGYQNATGEYRPQLQEAQAELANLQQDIANGEAKAAELPDLKSLSDKYFDSAADVSGDAESLSVTIQTYDMNRDMAGLEELLNELGFSPAVLERMGKTRALDGTQTAEGKNCNVTWTYHPDNGLGLVFEAVRNG